jgi:hypothetical protein
MILFIIFIVLTYVPFQFWLVGVNHPQQGGRIKVFIL